ncbi:MAG: hypothetical protein QNJ47_18565 [Nostocaceae cyanobacterium]|nr:hypothetical protein [Nostocaceae cyanobacterium]
MYWTQPKSAILESIDKFQLPLSELQAGDKLSYLTPFSTVSINHDFSISKESKEKLLVNKTLEYEKSEILKVKKPDYLGESKWAFKYRKKTIEAKINDLEWLNEFRQRKITIYPGDDVKARLKIIAKYDSMGKLISTHYSIEEVIEVMPMPLHEQISLFTEQDLDSNS